MGLNPLPAIMARQQKELTLPVLNQNLIYYWNSPQVVLINEDARKIAQDKIGV